MRCEACGKPMRSAWLVVAGRSYGPRCGRPLVLKPARKRRSDAGKSRGARAERLQLQLFEEAAT